MIGIIAEGPSDAEVVKSVLIGTLGIDGSQIRTLMPSQSYDESQLAAWGIDPSQSTWTLVVKECKDKKLIAEFIDVLGGDFVVIHLDTDTVHEPNFCGTRPIKDKNELEQYCIELREQVVQAIDGWLGIPYDSIASHAVAIEEIEAWLIPLFEQNLSKDSCEPPNAKSRLERLLSKQWSEKDLKSYTQISKGQQFAFLSKDLRKKKNLNHARSHSKSLDLFCQELASLVAP